MTHEKSYRDNSYPGGKENRDAFLLQREPLLSKSSQPRTDREKLSIKDVEEWKKP